MNILVTGATGFVGRHFIPDLVSKYPDSKIMTINRDVKQAEKFYPYANCIHISVDELDRIDFFCPTIVYHLASFISSRNDEEVISKILDANIIWGVKLLNTLKKCSSLKLFVNIGTFAEYRMGASEINNAYFYSTTKTAFKQFVDYYSDLCGFKYIHIVPYTIYGGKDTQKKIIDYIYDSFFAIDPVKMTKGEQVLDFIHVKDVASFLSFIIFEINSFTNLPNGEVLHLGSGKGIKIRELACLMEKAYNQKCNIDWGGLSYRDNDIMHAVAPIGKLLKLGWNPSYNLNNEINRNARERV